MPAADRATARLPSARTRFFRSERGQTFPFVVVLLFSLFIVAGVVINVGQAVNRRVFLQILADTGAFTGATEMARGMNSIATLNLVIQQAWASMTYSTVGFTVSACPASYLGVAGYKTVRGATGEFIRMVNIGYGRRARSEAESVTRFNAEDLFPGETIEMGETDAVNGILQQRPRAHLIDLDEVPSGTWPEVPALSAARTAATWICMAGPIPTEQSATFSLWFQKRRTPSPVAFVWVVKAPAARARVFDSFFGGRIIPKMTAAAVARPVGGEIKKARARYVAKMVPLYQLRSAVWDLKNRLMRTVHH